MADSDEGPLARAENGVTGPLYFDRQVVRAEDLTLGRTAAAAEMARIRRRRGAAGPPCIPPERGGRPAAFLRAAGALGKGATRSEPP
ncbi:hypothetical protein [Mangrovicoccus ximenensis]|uniref:hypothetical protein n=1 Tax=Mangrovicoccus ximenensis TaxID=1911570 RepID=UPI000D339F89|nr:hypothetical protein [Mangrovicoccus ximenensis]